MKASLLTYQITFKTVTINLNELNLIGHGLNISKIANNDFLFSYSNHIDFPYKFSSATFENNFDNNSYLQLDIFNKDNNRTHQHSFTLLLHMEDFIQANFDSLDSLIYSINLCKNERLLDLAIQKLMNDFELYSNFYILKENYLNIWGTNLKYSFVDMLLKLNTNNVKNFDYETKKLEELRQYIINNISKNSPTIEKMASMVGMSPTKFKVNFKKYTGYSPHQYILTVRLNKSFELLSTGSFSISQVAYRVGFHHPASFSRFFKQKYLQSPSTLIEANSLA